MKELLTNYTRYNVWANQIIIEQLVLLTEEEVDKHLGGSFPSIRLTMEHCWMAESIWLQRLKMSEHIILPKENFNGTFVEACKEWLACSAELLAFTEKNFDQRGFEHQFHYKNLKNEHFKSTVWECLQHVCNHSTFHRGQLITYLRNLGKSNLTSTDYITFSRLKK